MTDPSFDWAMIATTALVTYLLRAGGYFLMAAVPMTGRVKAGLDALPASIFIAVVAPAAVKAGPVGVIAVGAAGLSMWFSRSEILSIIVGLCMAAALRAGGL
ncbi:MAG: AzlD domain-containing protein [Hyphomicrobiales bacterium]|nr:AzlD domain-containing protein [Hyphomicrobiales bacterium]